MYVYAVSVEDTYIYINIRTYLYWYVNICIYTVSNKKTASLSEKNIRIPAINEYVSYNGDLISHFFQKYKNSKNLIFNERRQNV